MKKTMEKLNKKFIISIDAETNGLWGQPFSIGAVLYGPNGEEVKSFVGRCPIEGEVNEWVKENVLPQMEDIPTTHRSYKELLIDFFTFLAKAKELNAVAMCHMGHIVESNLLRDAHNMNIIGDWDAPYLWYDACLFFDDSVDNYNRENGIIVDEVDGGTHNPLYDCKAAYAAFKHFVSQK